MAKKDFTPLEVEILRHNPNVLDVKSNVIWYTEEFKENFRKERASGKGPVEIFKNAGFDIKVIGRKRIEKAAERWQYSTGKDGFFSLDTKKLIESNPNVKKVYNNTIYYKKEFSEFFMSEYLNGKKPTQIFQEAGFDIKIIGPKRIERAARRWKESYNKR